MEQKKTKQTVFKVIKISLNVLFYIFIVFMLVFSIANINKSDDVNIPNIFKRGFLAVMSDSMEGEEKDSFFDGDLIFVKILDEKGKQSLKIGDIITFSATIVDERGQAEKVLNTHRIIEIGTGFVKTQGDKAVKDHSDDKIETVSLANVLALHTGTWRGAGKVLQYIQTSSGFGYVIVLPTALLFSLELFFLIRNIILVNREKLKIEHAKDKEATKEEIQKQLESEREAMRQQILEELKKEKQEK